ncbi:hypothetical protein A2841_04100 [Candidatus Kaiserbacteria bacterium RIFCSPHIGHO2_01_FULL_48_10]|uniref:Uncharacterized protein n=1 Tax=Candidatus Kaiserbacteria bacterium RIFCSPHIGHO2_01_FULL_48_10 TaxID=1798476 RepID=A0A1F6C5Y7_9BACT|nr:MAG: hypothetical protein A2841_04100 [Candidatus Kaiserbacteria bacterium RIFCSPHIGHO2_01_FULL_48_10]
MKYSRLLLKITLLLLATTALYAQAQTGYTPLERLPGVDYESNNIGGFLQQLFTIGIGVAAFLAVIMIGIGGFEYMGGESITDKKEGRDRIVSAVLGLILILGSVLLLETINPSIISLNIGKVPLNLETVKPEPNQPFKVGETIGPTLGDVGGKVFAPGDAKGQGEYGRNCPQGTFPKLKCVQYDAKQKCNASLVSCNPQP